MPRLATVSSIRDSALAKLGKPNDGALSPHLLMVVDDAIQSAMREMYVRHSWLISRARRTITMVTGQKWYDLTDDQEPGRIERVTIIDSETPTEIPVGIDPDDDAMSATMQPMGYAIRMTQGVIRIRATAGGSGYTHGSTLTLTGGGAAVAAAATLTADGGVATGGAITNSGAEYTSAPTVAASGGSAAALVADLGPVVALYVAPAPDRAYSCQIEYLAEPAPWANDTDILPYDPEILSRLAAALVAETMSFPEAQILRQRAEAFIADQRAMQSDGAGASMSLVRGGDDRSGLDRWRGRW